MIFFDLPSISVADQRNYRKFRGFLVKNGFIMLQESVYSKLCINTAATDLVMKKIKKQTPEQGVIQALTITEKQYASMAYLVGKSKSNILDSADRLVIL